MAKMFTNGHFQVSTCVEWGLETLHKKKKKNHS